MVIGNGIKRRNLKLNFKKYLTKIFEQFEFAVFQNYKFFEIWINPSTQELSKIESFVKLKELRGICINNKNINYIFDSNILHSSVKKLIKEPGELINFFIDIKEKRIYFHEINEEDINLNNNNFLKIYFSGFDFMFDHTLSKKKFRKK